MDFCLAKCYNIYFDKSTIAGLETMEGSRTIKHLGFTHKRKLFTNGSS